MERVSADFDEHEINEFNKVGTPEPTLLTLWHTTELEARKLDFWWVPERPSPALTKNRKAEAKDDRESDTSPIANKKKEKVTPPQKKVGPTTSWDFVSPEQG